MIIYYGLQVIGMNDPLTYFATSFISILAIMNPLSTIGVFLSLTKNNPPEEKAKIAFKTSLMAFCVLIVFAITGFLIFQIYGITIEAFRIAGGLVLLVIGLRMLYPQTSSGTTPPEGGQIYIVPLAIPMSSGPGAITTVVVLASQATDFWMELSLWIAIFLSCTINYIVLRFSRNISRVLGSEGVAALIKIMGLLVCAVAVQFVITGLKVAFPVLAS